MKEFAQHPIDIPEAPSNQVTPDKRSVLLRWNNFQTNDGTAKSFSIEVNNKTCLIKKYPSQNHPINTLNITNLKPYTEYEIKMKAIKTDSKPLWKSTTKVKTLIAGWFHCKDINTRIMEINNTLIYRNIFLEVR
jgi:hypothetical protein